MELAKVVNNPLSSFPIQGRLIKRPHTALFPRTLLQNLNSSPTYPKSHLKSKLNAQNLNETTKNLPISVHSTSGAESSQKTTFGNAANVETSVPTMSEIMESSRLQNLDLQLQNIGPFFRITAKSLESGRELGRAEGIIRVWFGGKILHLDSMRLQRETIGMKKSIFGIGLFLGAVAIRFGYERGCIKAELLAINDSDLYHSKLVRFYKRLGFKKVYEVTGESIGDFSHMLVWGGVGTRMDANLEDLMIKWCSRFKPKRLI